MTPRLGDVPTPETARSAGLARLSVLSEDEIRSGASACFKRFQQHFQDQFVMGGKFVSIFRSLPKEISTEPWIDWILDRGAIPVFPRVKDKASATLDWVPLQEPRAEENWQRGELGIQEPAARFSAMSRDELKNLVLVLVPGVVFSKNLDRIGRGKGYYDRFLSLYPEPMRVGLGFDFQVMDPFPPSQVWDQRLDALVTPGRVWQKERKKS